MTSYSVFEYKKEKEQKHTHTRICNDINLSNRLIVSSVLFERNENEEKS